MVTPPAPAAVVDQEPPLLEQFPEPEPSQEEEEDGMRVTVGGPPPQPLVTDEHAPMFAFDANSLLAEALSRVLASPSWMDAIDLPAFAIALPQPERRAT